MILRGWRCGHKKCTIFEMSHVPLVVFICASVIPSSIPLPPLFNPLIFPFPYSSPQTYSTLFQFHDGVYSGQITSDKSTWYEPTLRFGHRHLTCIIHLKHLPILSIRNSPRLSPVAHSTARSFSKWKPNSNRSPCWLICRMIVVRSLMQSAHHCGILVDT